MCVGTHHYSCHVFRPCDLTCTIDQSITGKRGPVFVTMRVDGCDLEGQTLAVSGLVYVGHEKPQGAF